MKSGTGNALTALADLFLPRICCVCGGELGRNERYICLNCLADMPLTHNWLVRRNQMAERLNALISEHEVSDWAVVRHSDGSSREASFPDGASPEDAPAGESPGVAPTAEPGVDDCFSRYAHAVALFDFIKAGEYDGNNGRDGNNGNDWSVGNGGGYRNITWRLKYSRGIGEGRFFAAMLGERAARAEWLSDVDTVIPVPLHWTRRLSRGYNQAEVIAAEVAKALGARLRTDILVRRRRTKTQTKLGVEEKSRNVSGAFALSRRFTKNCGKETQAAGGGEGADGIRHILLVDDVFTTGSTLYNCWRPLHAFFGPSVRISVATLGVV